MGEASVLGEHQLVHSAYKITSHTPPSITAPVQPPCLTAVDMISP